MIGVLLFHQGDDLTKGGWMYTDSGAAQFNSIGELPHHIRWLTNLKFQQLRAYNLDKNGFLYADYLGAWHTVNNIAGCANVNASKPVVAETLFHAFTHVVGWMFKYFDVPNDDSLLPSLAKRINLLYPSPPICYGAEMDAIIKNASQPESGIVFCVDLTHSRQNLSEKTLYLSRSDHYLACLKNHALPSGKWISCKSFPKKGNLQEITDWVQQNNPLLINVLVHRMDEMASHLLNYTRKWITGNDLIYLSQFSEIEIVSAIAATETYSLPAPIQTLLNLLPEENNKYRLSVSFQLFVESVWASLLVKSTTQGASNMLIPYLRSMEISRCFHVAYQLVRSGIDVTSFGRGRFTIKTSLDDAGLAQQLRSLFVSHQIQLFCALDVSENTEGFNHPFRVIQEMYFSNQCDQFMELDKKIMLSVTNTKLLEE